MGKKNMLTLNNKMTGGVKSDVMEDRNGNKG